LGSLVVVSFVSQILDQAGRVASKGRRLTIADLLPHGLTTLTAATASKQVVVELVVSSRVCTIKDSRRGSFEANNDGLVLGVCEDMAAQTIILPSKVLGVVEASSDIDPVTSVRLDNVGVGSHTGKTENGLLVGNVWGVYVVHGPGRGGQRDGLSTHLASFQQAIDC
jgi:hypothetical protein